MVLGFRSFDWRAVVVMSDGWRLMEREGLGGEDWEARIGAKE